MKKLFSAALAALFTLAAVSSRAAEPFFLNKKGAEAEYAVKDPKGAVTSYTKSTVTEISTADPMNSDITYTVEVFDKNRKSMIAPMTSTISVKDGAVNTVAAAEGVEFEGTLPTYPATLSVGQVMEFSYKTNTMGIKSTIAGTNTVVARESVTTPAGTFDCYKVDNEVSSKALLNTVRMKTTTWLAAGVGVVKSETFDGKGKLQSSMELVARK